MNTTVDTPMDTPLNADERWHAVGSTDDFPDGDLWPVVADGLPIIVYREGEAFYALYDQCSHGPTRLSEGFVVDGCVECPLHQGLVDLKTGEPRSEPITVAVRAFATLVVGGEVRIAVPPVGTASLSKPAGAMAGCGTHGSACGTPQGS
jgi:anthranilate 1,2-dioxygenase ferredoxin subunit